MISSEVQRTLVKSPPELWAELSDPKSLARHLGELGEIRITKADPEKLVEWEAEEARGSVAIKASGWGTKVTLKASRDYQPADPQPEPEAPEPEASEPEAPVPETPAPETPGPEASAPETPGLESVLEPPAEAEPSSSGLDAWSRQEAEVIATAAERFEHEHPAVLLGSDLQLAGEREAETAAADLPDEQPEAQETQLEPEVQAPEPKLGFFARLFGRGRKNRERFEPVPTQAIALEDHPAEDEYEAAPAERQKVEAEASPTPADDPTPEADDGAGEQPAEVITTAPEPAPAADLGVPSPSPEDEPSPIADEPSQEPAMADIAAELKAAEEAAEEEVRAILTGVLDRLGAAHHRPFSRA